MFDRLADPLTGAPLTVDGDLLRNDAGVWPILGGVPVLVPHPAEHVAARHTALLGALAEHGRCDPAAVALARAFATSVRGVAPAPDPDDFLPDEEAPLTAAHPLVAEAFAARAALPDLLADRVGRGRVLEVGGGSGSLTRRLAAPVVCDRSLRAALVATAGLDATPVVGLAEALPFRAGTFRALVAANVIDLVDDPLAFLDGARRVLARGGRLVLSTPDPGLGTDDDGALAAMVRDAGFTVGEVVDAVPWVRAHGPRHAQLYVAQVVVATR